MNTQEMAKIWNELTECTDEKVKKAKLDELMEILTKDNDEKEWIWAFGAMQGALLEKTKEPKSAVEV